MVYIHGIFNKGELVHVFGFSNPCYYMTASQFFCKGGNYDVGFIIVCTCKKIINILDIYAFKCGNFSSVIIYSHKFKLLGQLPQNFLISVDDRDGMVTYHQSL